MISKYELTDKQWAEVERVANDSLKEFFVVSNDGSIRAIPENVRSLWLAQGGDPNQEINFSICDVGGVDLDLSECAPTENWDWETGWE